MIKKILFLSLTLAGVGLHVSADEDDYGALCTNVIAALTNETALLSPSFTNQLHVYVENSDARIRDLSRLALADALLTKYDVRFDLAAYADGRMFCSNVLFSTDSPARSWQKSVASLYYSWALRMDGRREEALAVCNTALSSHLASPTTDVERAVWSAMSRVDDLPEMDITNSLKIAAAISVSRERRSQEWSSYTNGLPPQAIQIILE